MITFMRKLTGMGTLLAGLLLLGLFLFPQGPITNLPIPLHKLDTRWRLLGLPEYAISVVGSVKSDEDASVLVLDKNRIVWACDPNSTECKSTQVRCQIIYDCSKDLPRAIDLGDSEYRINHCQVNYDAYSTFPGTIAQQIVLAARTQYVYCTNHTTPPTYRFVAIDANGQVWLSKVQGDDHIAGGFYLCGWLIGGVLIFVGMVLISSKN